MSSENKPQLASKQYLREMAFVIFNMSLCGIFMYGLTAYRLGEDFLHLDDSWLGFIMMLPIPHIPHMLGYFACIVISGALLVEMNVVSQHIVIKSLIRFFMTLTFFILFFGAGLACYNYKPPFPIYEHTYCGVISLTFLEAKP